MAGLESRSGTLKGLQEAIEKWPIDTAVLDHYEKIIFAISTRAQN